MNRCLTRLFHQSEITFTQSLGQGISSWRPLTRTLLAQPWTCLIASKALFTCFLEIVVLEYFLSQKDGNPLAKPFPVHYSMVDSAFVRQETVMLEFA